MFLQNGGNIKTFEAIFYTTKDNVQQAQMLAKMAEAHNGADAFLSMETIDPKSREDLQNVALSPISVVHLFRQYFFELDSSSARPRATFG